MKKKGFYARLAWTGIRKNYRLYIPYLLTCAGMVMMEYIILFLQNSPLLQGTRGGGTMRETLLFGSWVVAVFAAIFLFYTHSFLIRRRMKEFGLYNILGMGKWHIGMIVVWESVITAVIALASGLALGVVFSKLAELVMLNLLHRGTTFTLSVSPVGLMQTARIFGAIFLLILLHALWRMRRASAMELLRSENAGERPPKANWVLGAAGVVLLAGAYWLAVTISDPVSAMVWFFVAVLMVIVGTYLTFIAGSVTLCRLLQKSRRFYYKASHFVSVSSMAYRMKRNGAGLASICILATMVLVMLSSTTCLYFGAEDSLQARYPRDMNITLYVHRAEYMEDAWLNSFRAATREAVEGAGLAQENVLDYRVASITGLLQEDGVLDPDSSGVAETGTNLQLWDIRTLNFISLDDYNRLTGSHEALGPDEVLLQAFRSDYPYDTLTVKGQQTFRIREQVKDIPSSGSTAAMMFPTLYVVVSDLTAALQPMTALADYRGEPMLNMHWYYSFDLPADKEEQIALSETLSDRLYQLDEVSAMLENGGFGLSVENREENRDDFFNTFGSLFFLGVLLSIVFIFAAVLMIYYKQLSEGYEDQARFDIMQKVGMTRRDIRRSVNAQLLMVFFLPLGAALCHLVFAFPMVRLILMLFNLNNVGLFLRTTLISFLLFAALYLAVYKLTAHVYYKIVSGAIEQ